MIRLVFPFTVFIMIACKEKKQEKNFRPERISKTASFTVRDSIDKAFPLFGPIREKEWAAGWEPEIIFSESPEVEERMMFKTSSSHHDEEFIWTITQFRPQDYLIEYTVSAAERIWFIRVQCQPTETHTTKVTVSYTYTGLSLPGNIKNKEALDKMFAHNLIDWEQSINYYLLTGEQLK